MTTLTLLARGTAPVDAAWERYADPQLWPTWSPQIQRVTTSTPRLETGTTGTVHAGLLPRPTVPVPFTVLEVDDVRRRWAWRVSLGPVRLHLEHGVDPDDTGGDPGSATWLRMAGPLPVVLPYAPLARIALSRLVRG
jgi:hypothetical protein